DQFLEAINSAEGTAKRLSADARERIRAYPWPGNVRELKNELQRAFIMAEEVIDFDGLAPPPPRRQRSGPAPSSRPTWGVRSTMPSARSSSPPSSVAAATRSGLPR